MSPALQPRKEDSRASTVQLGANGECRILPAFSDLSFELQFGKKIRTLRRRKGWTQAKLSEITRIARTHITEIERGTCGVSLHTIKRLALGLRIEPGDLFEGVWVGMTQTLNSQNDAKSSGEILRKP